MTKAIAAAKKKDERKAPTAPTKVALRELAQRNIDQRTIVRCFFPAVEARLFEKRDGEDLANVLLDKPVIAAQGDATVERTDGAAELVVERADGDEPAKGMEEIEAVINTADVDRYNTIVDPSGAVLEEYAENPMLLWQHGQDAQIGSWPVGRVTKLTKGTEIVARVVFDNSPLGVELDRLYREKMLRGFSIGFIPLSYVVEERDGVEILRYTSWVLVELSCVAVPANPRALARAMSKAASNDDAKLKEFREFISRQIADLAMRALLGDEDEPTVVTRTLEAPVGTQAVQPVAKGGVAPSGASTTSQPPTSTRVAPVAATEKPGVTFDRVFKHQAECRAASPEVLRSMAALADVEGEGEKLTIKRAMFVHHHADGELSFPALAVGMARLLSAGDEEGLTPELRDTIYEHLAAHYRELEIEPPTGGYTTPDELFAMALEGRVAHLDEAGYGWIFVEAVERDVDGAKLVYPGFVRVDDRKAQLLLTPPAEGPHADHRGWGQRKALVRGGAKFSYQTKAALLSCASNIEVTCDAILETVQGQVDSLRQAATGLRSMLEPTEDGASESDGSGRDSGVGGPAEIATKSAPRDTGFARRLTGALTS